MVNIDMSEMADVMTAVTHYKTLAGYTTQLDPAQRTSLEIYHQKMVGYSRDKKYHDDMSLQYWNEVDMHMTKKTWGSTSCGWGGMGGAAMTSAYTLVFENHWGQAAFVYWGGKLAYICHMDEMYQATKTSLPGLDSCEQRLNIIYKNTRR
jgi:hypothetical protein